MKIVQLTCIIVAITIAAICQPLLGRRLAAPAPGAVIERDGRESTGSLALAATPGPSSSRAALPTGDEKPARADAAVTVDATNVLAFSPAALSLREPSLFREASVAIADDEVRTALPNSLVFAPAALAPRQAALFREETALLEDADEDEALPEEDYSASRNSSPDRLPHEGDLSYLVDYPYAELPPEKKPADIVLAALKDVPVGTPIEEIRRAAHAFGLDFNFMKAVAKIESDFDPKQRTGSYIGLFQLNNYEFRLYGSGDITSSRDNAVAAAYKFVTEAALFELSTHKRPSFSDLYLIHQQGWQGAAEHISHPERVAWKSMCATDEGMEKGEKWCKRAIWGNTISTLKHIWKSVDHLTSAAFVDMWRERLNGLYTRYSEATLEKEH